MMKTVFLFLLGLMIFQSAKAQKADSVLLYMDKQDRIVDTKDSADHYLLIINPPDSSTGVKINRIEDFYLNKKIRFLGAANISFYRRYVNMAFEGPCIYYYPNGHMGSMNTYKNGMFDGYSKFYYPNGKLYSFSIRNKIDKLIECRDSTGNVLARDGNGKWVKYDFYFKHKLEEGTIKDSLQEGKWQTFVDDSAKYLLVYKHGIAVSSTQPGWFDKIFFTVDVEPQFKNGGFAGFKNFLAKSVVYPNVDRINGTQGMVIATFVVEKNGELSGVAVLKSPDGNMADAVVQAIKKSPLWVPGMQNGKPVRVQFTVPFNFSLTDNKK